MSGRVPDRLLVGLVCLFALLGDGSAAQGQSRDGAPRPLVVIDAGHGGVDPGARGPSGTLEKSVTLSVARELAAILREDASLEVRLTRDRDTLIALADRPRLANRWRAAGGPDRPALFISIHANAHARSSASGFETYFLSEALSDESRRVAERENSAQQYEEASNGSRDPLSFIFNDLRGTLYLHESSAWAGLIQSRLDRALPGPNRGVKQAGFVVLMGAQMPAVLVEVGFITNPREEKLLATKAAHREMARELSEAIRQYFARSAGAVTNP